MPRKRIVAVDDDRRILRLLKRVGESAGYEVHSVLDPGFFESAFRVFQPSLVLLDLNMRDTDGVEILRFIAGEHVDTSIILTSGVDERLLGAANSLGLSLGLDMLQPIRKPLVLAELRERLDAFRERRARQREPGVPASTLRRAIDRGLVEVHYQPIIDLATHKVTCVEALARLRHPGGGLVPPALFIPVAERSGLIGRLTFHVLEQALADLATWSGIQPALQVAVNMSPLLLDDVTLPDRIAALLERRNVAFERLIVEVTETTMADDRRLMADTLSRLRLKGIGLALDDFGTGFCSLGQLYEYPYDKLKLDKKFAMCAHEDGSAAAMIRASLDLARSLDLTVVVEGIENAATLRWLRDLGCHSGQGFHISPPLSAATLSEWLARGEPVATETGLEPTLVDAIATG